MSASDEPKIVVACGCGVRASFQQQGDPASEPHERNGILHRYGPDAVCKPVAKWGARDE